MSEEFIHEPKKKINPVLILFLNLLFYYGSVSENTSARFLLNTRHASKTMQSYPQLFVNMLYFLIKEVGF